MFAQKRLWKEGECKTFLWYVRGYILTFNLCLNDEIFLHFLYWYKSGAINKIMN